MRRADRLFQIVQYLRGGRLLTAAQLSERLEVSERTIYRDIADLTSTGVPIDGEAGVGYLMRSGFDLPPLMFTRAEIVALVGGARMMREWGGAAMALAAEEALIKINAVLPADLQNQLDGVNIHAINAGTISRPVKDLIDRLDQEIDDRHRLMIDYEDLQNQKTRRTIKPLGLWFWGRVWTLVSWCELRDDFRVFRLDRIEKIETLDQFRPQREWSLATFYAREVAKHKSHKDQQ